MNFRPWLLLPASLLMVGVFGACGSDEDDGTAEADSGVGAGSSGQPQANMVGAAGVRITQVAIYQGVKRTLMLEGAAQPATVPLIPGRDTLIRVFYTVDAGYDGAAVTGRLQMAGVDPPIEVSAPLNAAGSVDGDLASTVNLYVAGAAIGASIDYSVALLQERPEGTADNTAARWPAAGTEVIPVEGPQNTLRIKLAPFQYNADGSGRLPDTSPAMVEAYRKRFLALYPVSNVEVTVRPATPWNQGIFPNGQGWQEVGQTTFGFRSQDGAPDDLYYYAIFNPAEDIYEFCGGGCLLGVTLLNSDPPDVGNVQLRLALGVGFNDVALDTAAHEIGHAHGRPHAPCGPGLDPQSIDPAYPHAGGLIGTWGYDITTGQLVDPAVASDIMGYCDNQYISDYNFMALFNRGKNVNLPKKAPPMAPPGEYELLSIDGERAQWGEVVHRGQPIAGDLVHVSLRDEDNNWRAAEGHYVRFDHLPGGWLFLPKDAGFSRATRADMVIDGIRVSAVR